MRIGFIGLGAMGRHMAANLQRAGHELQVYDLRKVEGFPNQKSSVAEAVKGCEVVFVAVGTPQDASGAADLTAVLQVAKSVAKAMDGHRVIVLKSTVPVGTAARVKAVLGAETKHPFAIVSNPEFLKEGAAVDDFLRPDRVVIGTEDPAIEAVMRKLYEPFVRTGNPILVMDHVSAELTKYAANAMLATRISFMNEIANLCDKVGADVRQVRLGLGRDSRIGTSFLFPGVGYGGSCFPKDIKALLHTGEEAGVKLEVVAAVDRANDNQKRILVPRIEAKLGGLSGKVIALWGLAFKPRTDDMRDAPALAITAELLAKGASVKAYDPKAAHEAKSTPIACRCSRCSVPTLSGRAGQGWIRR